VNGPELKSKIQSLVSYGLSQGMKLEDSEDFSSFAIERILRDRKANYFQLSTDYLRTKSGVKGGQFYEVKRNLDKPFEFIDNLHAQNDIRTKKELRRFDKYLKGLDLSIWILYTKWGLTYEELAEVFDFSVWTCHHKVVNILNILKKKTKRFGKDW